VLVVHTYISQAISIASLKMSDSASPAKTKAKKVSVPAAHPTYLEMITAAITVLKGKKGSSRHAIKKYLHEIYKVDYGVSDKAKKLTNSALSRGIAAGSITATKGTFKLSVKPKPTGVKKVKKPVAKKPAAKKSTAKKAAPKKNTPKKKPAAKKPKKPVAKKPAAKKAAPKKKTPKKKPAAKKAKK